MSLVFEGVSRKVGAETHIYPIDLALEPGSLNVILGPTLAGKTSILRLMAGLDKPSGGRILVNGADSKGIPLRRRQVAMVYQQFINYPSFTVFDNIASPLRRAGLDRAEIDRRVGEIAEVLKLTPLLRRLPAELSGGQQQRTALARALAKEADLLLLDEPLVNLDYKLREELREELRAIFRRRSAIVVYATTEPGEALMIGGRGSVLILDQGRLLQSGSTLAAYHEPASLRVGEVFSDPPMNLIAGQVADGRAKLGTDLELPLAGQLGRLNPGDYTFGVRANHLFVARQAEDDVAIDATVELAEISGSETFIHAAHSGTAWVAQEEGVHSLGLGEAIQVFVNPRHLFAFDEAGRLMAAPARSAAPMAAQ